MLRWIFALAALATLTGLVGLSASSRAVVHYPVMLGDGVPAVVYEPPASDVRPPVVVLVHGFAGDAAGMSTLARRLARAGYGVVTPVLRGHASNPRPIPRRILNGPREGLREDIDAAMLFARGSGRFDPDRVALAGHSMGASAALDYASTDPSVSAVVAISGAQPWTGPYRPPNVLLVWASGDSAATRLQARRLGEKLSQLRQIVADRVYGDIDRGTAVKATEIDGTHHWSVIQSSVTGDRMLDWLERSLGPGSPASGDAADGRFLWSAVVGLGLVLTLLGLVESLGGMLPDPTPSTPARPRVRGLLELSLALAFATLLAAGTDLGVSAGPLGFVPLAGSREVLAVLAISGAALCAAWGPGDGRRLGDGFGARAGVIAALLFAPLYLLGGAVLAPVTEAWLTPQRLPWFVLCSALALPFFLAVEQRFRAEPGLRTAAASITARLLVVIALAVGGLSGILSIATLIVLLRLLVVFIAFEALALRLVRTAPAPWALALAQSAWVGWLAAAGSPFEG